MAEVIASVVKLCTSLCEDDEEWWKLSEALNLLRFQHSKPEQVMVYILEHYFRDDIFFSF